MTNKPTWKQIDVYGLSRYEISEVGVVRRANGREQVSSYFNKKMTECVDIKTGGRIKTFEVRELVYKTFNTRIDPDKNHPDYKFTRSPEMFSENEDDYGKGVNTRYWREIKELAKRARLAAENQ